jgi:hypothetical protein
MNKINKIGYGFMQQGMYIVTARGSAMLAYVMQENKSSTVFTNRSRRWIGSRDITVGIATGYELGE